MKKRTSLITLLMMTLLLTLATSTGVFATVATDQAISPSATTNYTLFYNSNNGKMYTDQAMTNAYTEQTGKWNSVYDTGTQTYILNLKNFSFSTSAPIGLTLPYNTIIQLEPGTTNEISSSDYLGIDSNSYGLLAKNNLTICSTGDGSGSLSANSGTSYTFQGYHSCGLRIEGNLQLFSGHVFVCGGGDNNSNGMETVSMDFYNGECATQGSHRGLSFIQTASNYLNYVPGTAIYGGMDAVSRSRLDVDSGSSNVGEQLAYPSIYIINIYPDVPYNAWYAKPIYVLIENSIVSGYANADGITFNINPGKNITRAEFVTILARIFESETDLAQYAGEYAFTDVPEWASKYVGWAAKYEYVNGLDSTHFGSADNITREQMAAILCRIVDDMELTAHSSKPAITFTDEGQIDAYALNAVRTMQQAGVINGYNNGNGTYSFNPKGQATRAEAFTMIYNFLNTYFAK